jgi:hypothetical protein
MTRRIDILKIIAVCAVWVACSITWRITVYHGRNP